LSATDIALLSGLIFAAAILYTSVGHAGASGYLAAMALFGLAPEVMKPTALTLNILVASVAVMRLRQAGLVNWRPLLPLVAGSIPLAFIGDRSSCRVRGIACSSDSSSSRHPRSSSSIRAKAPPGAGSRAVESIPILPALLAGGLIGLLSGLTGTGGGIFLSPLLLLFGWAGARQQAGITAPFILVNSIAGLAGTWSHCGACPPTCPTS
jgi:uncharacterized membrane protein YfcA